VRNSLTLTKSLSLPVYAASAPLRAAFLRQANGGHLDCAIMLLENGADVNARGKTGSTPLKYAKEEGHEAMARMLEARGGTDAALPPAAAVKRSLRK
jgi:ankyrin repeat protein